MVAAVVNKGGDEMSLSGLEIGYTFGEDCYMDVVPDDVFIGGAVVLEGSLEPQGQFNLTSTLTAAQLEAPQEMVEHCRAGE